MELLEKMMKGRVFGLGYLGLSGGIRSGCERKRRESSSSGESSKEEERAMFTY